MARPKPTSTNRGRLAEIPAECVDRPRSATLVDDLSLLSFLDFDALLRYFPHP